MNKMRWYKLAKEYSASFLAKSKIAKSRFLNRFDKLSPSMKESFKKYGMALKVAVRENGEKQIHLYAAKHGEYGFDWFPFMEVSPKMVKKLKTLKNLLPLASGEIY